MRDNQSAELQQTLSKNLGIVFIWGFIYGIAKVEKQGRTFFIDKEGNDLLFNSYLVGEPKVELGFVYSPYDRLWYFINIDGDITEGYEAQDYFSEGFAAVCKNQKWFYIDVEGKRLNDEEFDEVGSFAGGVASVLKDEKEYELFKDGKLVEVKV